MPFGQAGTSLLQRLAEVADAVARGASEQGIGAALEAPLKRDGEAWRGESTRWPVDVSVDRVGPGKALLLQLSVRIAAGVRVEDLTKRWGPPRVATAAKQSLLSFEHHSPAGEVAIQATALGVAPASEVLGLSMERLDSSPP